MTSFETVRYQSGRTYRAISRRAYATLFGINLWAKRLHYIEGQYGTATVSYFVLMRWLVVLNLLSAIVLVGFVIVPQAIDGVDAPSAPFKPQNIILGDGYFQSSVLFIGTFKSQPEEATFPYNIPLA